MPYTIRRKLRTLISLHHGLAAIALAIVGGTAVGSAQAASPEQCPSAPPDTDIAVRSTAERAREMALLGIPAMQAPVRAYELGTPCSANFNEALANPHPRLPALLVLANGRRVTPATWQRRRKEIKAIFDDQVYGRYPANIPGVTWSIVGVERVPVHGIKAVVKHVVGHVDNSAYRAINVTIQLDVVTPASALGQKVPVIIGGGSVLPHPTFTRPAPRPGEQLHLLSAPADAPDSESLLLRKGWGFVWINTNEVQADNGAGLDKGIIGLVNKGRPRSLTDWGVLRAWAWADSRAIDYLLTDRDVDGNRVGIMGHSRGGKAALVAMADDPRIAIGFISSSGAGGVNLYRRNYGEVVPNLAAPNEFHWFAGNFLKYAAVGHSIDELPVDAHEFLALVAPRPVFIGAGALLTDPKYFPGDAWQDSRGMFMSAVAASPAWTLLGAEGIETTTFPAPNTLLKRGDVGFRQHQYGHTPAPNWPAFIEFASKYFDRQ